MDSRLAPPGWWQALSAAGIALAVDALYIAIIRSEGEGELTSRRVLFVAACLGGAGLALISAQFVGPKARAILLSGAAAMLGAWTVLTFSIGLLLVPAAILAGYAAGQVVAEARREAFLAAAGAVVLVAVGLLLT
ncbi:MAG TPA: hypothetical protein VJU01_02225 [Gaiellaceae bacterium]|nr:hypothetical protein [Gaiellaceae bacterium]